MQCPEKRFVLKAFHSNLQKEVMRLQLHGSQLIVMGIVRNVTTTKLKAASDKLETSILLANSHLKSLFYRAKQMCYGIFKALRFMWTHKSGGNKL